MWSALAHPDLKDCRRVFLRAFSVDANIGVHDSEKNGPQRVVISVDLFVPLEASRPVHDRIDEVLDYDFIRETVLSRVSRGHINLQESLCDDVADALLLNPKVRAVRVSTEKPDVYADCDAVGIEVFRFRS